MLQVQLVSILLPYSVQPGASAVSSNTGSFRIDNGDLLQSLAYRLHLPPGVESRESLRRWSALSFYEKIHNVLFFLPYLTQVSLHGNMMSLKHLVQDLVMLEIYTLSSIILACPQLVVGHCYYLQSTLTEEAGHFTQLEVYLELIYGRTTTGGSHCENSYNVRLTD